MLMLRQNNEIVSNAAASKLIGSANDAKIAHILLSGIVSDPVEYAIREICTNAWEAAPRKPFELTLPSKFVNIFRVRDFGKGLSHNFVMTRYVKIGHSTKDKSDDSIGGWGLGSKSPLAYLQGGAFDLISRHQGTRRAYNIGIDATGQIRVSFLGEAPDTETGIEVSFPVRPADVDRFRATAERVLFGFEPRPRGLPDRSGKCLIQAPTWSTWTDTSWTGPHVRIGVVMYSVRLNQLDGLSGFVNQTDNLLLEAPIGSLSVSASREQLSFDDRTKATLVDLLKTYEADFFTKAEAEMAKCATYFDAAAVAHRLCRTYGWGRTNQLFLRLTWRGLPMQREVFPDTTPSAFYRAFKCGGFPEKFRAGTYQPEDLRERQIVVEHFSYRSLDRLEALGFDGSSRLLWVRVKKEFLPVFLRDFGLTEADVTIMDNVKLPKRVLDPKAPDGPKTKIRVRKQLNWDGHPVTEPVDLLAGGFYVHAPKVSRYDHKVIDLNPWVNSTSFHRPRVDRLPGFFRPLKTAGIINDDLTDRPILYLTRDDEVLPDGWEPLGPALQARALELLDPTQLTPRVTWNAASFPYELGILDKFDLGLCPQDLLDLVHRRRQLLARVSDVAQSFNDHDRIADVLRTVVKAVAIPTAADPSLSVTTDWHAVSAKYPLLGFVINENSLQYGKCFRTGEKKYDAVTEDNQRIMNTYFRLVTAR